MSEETKPTRTLGRRPRRAGRAAVFMIVAAASFALLTAIASAQTKKRDKKPAPLPKKPTPTAIADAAAPARETPTATRPEPTPKGGPSTAREDGGVMVTKTGDGGTSLRFGEMEIEGRLRNPQLVYFLRRVRAEFAAGDLGHRSFMQELGETKNEQSF